MVFIKLNCIQIQYFKIKLLEFKCNKELILCANNTYLSEPVEPEPRLSMYVRQAP